ncbi:methyltransferase family protein [Glaciecola sp. 1036]|uniref:methyltransferase family protein n=1 Tax=Alteromonadaceae TaxID=72275 RepID=UPI003CFC80D4
MINVPPVVQALVAAILMSTVAIIDRQYSGMLRGIAVGLAFIGMAIAVIGVWQFKKHRTTVNPVSPEKSSTLVTWGIYAYTRNPMYVGMVFVLIAWALWLGSAFSLIIVPLFMLSMTYLQIKREEIALQQIFGDDYIEYSNKVRRWL